MLNRALSHRRLLLMTLSLTYTLISLLHRISSLQNFCREEPID